MLTVLGFIATQQVAPTENTMRKIHQFSDYSATHPGAIITLSANDMFLTGHSDAYYLLDTKDRSRAGGHFFLSKNLTDPPKNIAVLSVAHTIKAVMSYAAEA